jgi:osmoprotectant transport system permease protein
VLTRLLANDADSFIWWEWVGEHTSDIWERTREHFWLTIIAVAIGLLISTVLAAIALRFRWTSGPIVSATNVIYTIPSLALFGFLIPITHLGFRTAMIGLVSYTLLILVRNIITAIDGVPPAVKEAADGMGFSRWRRFFAVDLRLATPGIVAGVRIASVTTVGLVTVTALIGEGGYGVFILDGIDRRFSTPIVVGAFCSIALAIVLDVVFVVTERALTPWARRGVGRRREAAAK